MYVWPNHRILQLHRGRSAFAVAVEAKIASTGSLLTSLFCPQDEVECPICTDVLDISDLNFKPCSCGYQVSVCDAFTRSWRCTDSAYSSANAASTIDRLPRFAFHLSKLALNASFAYASVTTQICRFCWHHIKESLNNRCPACRREYDDAAVEFKPVKPEEIKRIQAARKQREREKRENNNGLPAASSSEFAPVAGSSGRRNQPTSSSVRVRQRAQVHVQGYTTRTANDDTMSYFRSNEQYGKYGKILKLFHTRKAALNGQSSSSSTSATPVNLYVNYSQPNEAAACIAAVDGSVTPDGHKLKAIWGTTRYCPTYLRGQRCMNESCMQAHEPGEEVDANATGYSHQYHSQSNRERVAAQAVKDAGSSREDVIDLKNAWKEQQAQSQPNGKDRETFPALPATASWASKAPSNVATLSTTASWGAVPSPAAQPAGFVPSHTHSNSISARLPKAQNHPLPARPTSVSSAVSAEAIGKRRDPAKAPLQPVVVPPQSAVAAEPSSATSALRSAKSDSVQPQSLAIPSTPELALPAKQPAALALPPGIPINPGLPPSKAPVTPEKRPLTPVSEFERTLGTFGDGSSFAFNLSAHLPADSPQKQLTATGRAPLSASASLAGTDVTPSKRISRSNSAAGEAGRANGVVGSRRPSRDASPAPSEGTSNSSLSRHSSFGILNNGAMNHDKRTVSISDLDGVLVNQMELVTPVTESSDAYQGGFNPWSFGPETTPHANDRTSVGIGLPPGLGPLSKPTDTAVAAPQKTPSLMHTTAPDADAAGANRNRSRFGFARPGVADRSRSISGLNPAGSSSTASVSDLLKDVHLGGRISPNRPTSAASSGSGFSFPPGMFPANGHLPTAPVANMTLPPKPASALPDAAHGLPDKPRSKTPGRSLAELFPGVDINATLSTSNSTISPAIAKTLGINLDNLDLTASSGLDSKIASITAAMGSQNDNASLANQPLPPLSNGVVSNGAGSLSSSHASLSSGGQSTGSSQTSGSTHHGVFATSRHGQHAQALAQQAQQAHQAHMAAQQANRAASAQAAQQGFRPPSSLSGAGSIKSPPGIGDAFGPFMGITSPPMPPTPDTASYVDGSGRFQDPAIVSFANGYHPYANGAFSHQHHAGAAGMDGLASGAPPPGLHGASTVNGNQDYYSRFGAMPGPQPQLYNPYMAVGPPGLSGMNRMASQTMPQASAFGVLRR